MERALSDWHDAGRPARYDSHETHVSIAWQLSAWTADERLLEHPWADIRDELGREFPLVALWSGAPPSIDDERLVQTTGSVRGAIWLEAREMVRVRWAWPIAAIGSDHRLLPMAMHWLRALRARETNGDEPFSRASSVMTIELAWTRDTIYVHEAVPHDLRVDSTVADAILLLLRQAGAATGRQVLIANDSPLIALASRATFAETVDLTESTAGSVPLRPWIPPSNPLPAEYGLNRPLDTMAQCLEFFQLPNSLSMLGDVDDPAAAFASPESKRALTAHGLVDRLPDGLAQRLGHPLAAPGWTRAQRDQIKPLWNLVRARVYASTRASLVALNFAGWADGSMHLDLQWTTVLTDEERATLAEQSHLPSAEHALYITRVVYEDAEEQPLLAAESAKLLERTLRALSGAFTLPVVMTQRPDDVRRVLVIV